jgi:hypothetical protein
MTTAVQGGCSATASTPSQPLGEGLEAHTPPTPSRPFRARGWWWCLAAGLWPECQLSDQG